MRLLLLTALLSASAFAQKMQTSAGEAPGPWLLGTLGIGKQPDGTMKTTALKGLAIKVGEHGEATVAYDLDLCRMAGAWTGKFTTPMNLMSRGEFPTAMGEVALTTEAVAGFVRGDVQESWKDPRSEPFGPLPPGQARFRGFYVNGDKTILRWDIGGVEVLEMPLYKREGELAWFERIFWIGPHTAPVVLTWPKWDKAVGSIRGKSGGIILPGKIHVLQDDQARTVGTLAEVRGYASIPWRETPSGDIEELAPLPNLFPGDGTRIEIPPFAKPTPLRLEYWQGPADQVDAFFAVRFDIEPKDRLAIPDLKKLVSGGPTRWPEPVITTGELSKDTESAYVVDTIKLPDPNPWGAPMFVGGFDFFETGKRIPDTGKAAAPALSGIRYPQSGIWDAAVCTFHGDVFLVSGIDEKLEKVTWKRFATGLYHALGLRIVNGEIYVTCRDGLWRLRDLNGDGEADFYEAFNFDVKVTKNFHEFVFDLQTDPAGNFYFAKAGPVKNGGRGFDEIMAHHGSLFRVSPDGGKFEVIATGFRAPTGIGVGPRGELTSGDNEGTWTPVCKINWIKPGGFYGVVPLAHRDPPPTSYDPPLCWLPKRVDNSGGSQVWAPEGERWGPWGGRMLHLSYGQAALYGVLFEEIGERTEDTGKRIPDTGKPAASPLSDIRYRPSGIVQGGVTKFPLQFQSGIMRARFHPKDGQLYVAGLRGWQTSGLKNGCFQRIRYTGAETRMPIEMHVKKDGIELRFTASLDTQSARDPENWHLEQWRYLWSSAYGSPELSAATDPDAPAELGKDGSPQFTRTQMGQAKHDPVTVKSVTIGTDDRTVFLEIPDLKPVMQMSIKYDLKTADGKELRGEVVNTIHALGRE